MIINLIIDQNTYRYVQVLCLEKINFWKTVLVKELWEQVKKSKKTDCTIEKKISYFAAGQ